MLKSMTGFGKEEAQINEKTVCVEIRALNSKQLDLNLRLPHIYKAAEAEMRTLSATVLERGRIDIFIDIAQQNETPAYTINKPLFVQMKKEINSLIDKPLSDNEILPVIMRCPEIYKQYKENIHQTELEALVKLAEKTINAVDAYRINEGKALQKDIAAHVKNIKQKLPLIDKEDKQRIEAVKEKLRQHFSKIENETPCDANRFEQELIYYIEKLDISEEKQRLNQHCTYFNDTMSLKQSNGKKLSFIVQEMGREINTIGAKANNFNIQKIVVEMKDELEKIREQLGNVL